MRYETLEYPFGEFFKNSVFCVPDLGDMHSTDKKNIDTLLKYKHNLQIREKMQSLNDDSIFYKIYNEFMRNYVSRFFGGKISYSQHPKMRVHLAGTSSVSLWHRDVDITHRPDQINMWVPVTDCFSSNSLFVESDYGRSDYRPIDVRYGEVLFFDGGYLSHGTVDNATNKTRVSFDLRFSVLRSPLPALAQAIIGNRPG
jgi:hypothetical protein